MKLILTKKAAAVTRLLAHSRGWPAHTAEAGPRTHLLSKNLVLAMLIPQTLPLSEDNDKLASC